MDTDELIKMVQEYPALYNPNHADYLRVKLKDDIWERIGIVFGVEGTTAKEKWHKLRDCHREALRRQKNKPRQKRESVRPWIYQEEMKFLLPFMKNTSTTEPSTPESADEDDERVSRDNDSVQEKIQEIPSKNSRKRIRVDTEDPVVQEKVDNLSKSVLKPHEVRKFFGECQQRAQKRDDLRRELISKSSIAEQDALYLFFMAMYGSTKKLPQTFQRRIRNKIFEIVSQTEEECDFYKNTDSANVEMPVSCQSTSDGSPWVDDMKIEESSHELEEDIGENNSTMSFNNIYTENLYDDESIDIKEELLE